jgi:hypothetical protein
VHATPLVNPGHDRAVADPATHGLAQPQTPLAKVQCPVWRKFGLGAMFAGGLEIEEGIFAAGGLFAIVVVVTGSVVVGVGATVVVGTGTVVVVVVGVADAVGTFLRGD